MDWTEAETQLATLEREVIRCQRQAREQQALARADGRGAVVPGGPGRWLGLGHWLWCHLPAPAAPDPALDALAVPAGQRSLGACAAMVDPALPT